MPWISSHRGELQVLGENRFASASIRTFRTGLATLDQLLPNEGFACAAIHEILTDSSEILPLSFALLLARAASSTPPALHAAWLDPDHLLYPPGLARAFPLDRLLILRPGDERQLLWAVTECLRCPALGATIAAVRSLTPIHARRIQLAAETGGGVGILLRPAGRCSAHYAAATRWLVQPIPGQSTLQRWRLQLTHGHGGRMGQSVILEVCRATHRMRAFEPVADRSMGSASQRKRA